MSWIIVNRKTNKAVFETFKKSTTLKIDTKKYKVITAYEYLCGLNEADEIL